METTLTLDEINIRYGLKNHIFIEEKSPGFPIITLQSPSATATVAAAFSFKTTTMKFEQKAFESEIGKCLELRLIAQNKNNNKGDALKN